MSAFQFCTTFGGFFGGINVKVTRFQIDYNRLSYYLCAKTKNLSSMKVELLSVSFYLFFRLRPLFKIESSSY